MKKLNNFLKATQLMLSDLKIVFSPLSDIISLKSQPISSTVSEKNPKLVKSFILKSPLSVLLEEQSKKNVLLARFHY